MTNVSIAKKDVNSVEVLMGSKSAGVLKASIIRTGNGAFHRPWACEVGAVCCDDEKAIAEFRCDEQDISAVVELERSSSGFVGKFRASGKGYAIIRLIWELPKGEKGFALMPAFMYDFNEGGKDPDATYPQLDNGHNNPGFSKPWIEKEWLVRADRSSHCVSSVITGEFTCAIGGRDVCRYSDGRVAEKNGLGISSDDPYQISFSLGFINMPHTYSVIGGRNFHGRMEGYVNLDEGAAESEFFLMLYESPSRQKAAAKLLRDSYAFLHEKINDAGTVEDAVVAVSEALTTYGYNEEAKNFHCSLYFDNTPKADVKDEVFNNGWSGGSPVAYPLLVAGHQLNRPEWIKCARDILSDMAENALNEKSGLFYENYCLDKDRWFTAGWWTYSANEGHSSYVNGHMCHYLLKGYLLEQQAGQERANWLNSARKVLDHVASIQTEDGNFGYIYSEEDGSIVDPVGFAGCWFVPAFANLYKITGQERYLDVARKAMDFYRNDVEAFNVYGGPHDTWKSPDEEGILAWVKAARLLHEITGEERFLNDLLMGLDYEFSWKFAYNVVNEIEPLKSMNWCSTGGCVTSVNNSHIHPMGSSIAPTILYAYEQTKDEYLKARLIDTVRWTLTVYLHYDGEYGWGKKGLINERFCYTDSLLIERFPDGSPASTWFCGHSWASGAVLGGLAGEILDVERKDKSMILGK